MLTWVTSNSGGFGEFGEFGFIFQQDGASARTQRATPRSAQNRMRAGCPDIITKDQWPPNSPNILTQWTITYGVQCWRLTASLKQIRKQAPNSRKRFRLCGVICNRDRSTRPVLSLGAGGEHFEHLQWRWNSGIWSLVSCVVSTILLNKCCSRNIFEC